MGSDPADLERLARLCDRISAEVDNGRSSVHQRVHGAFWRGPDADRFRSEWDGEHAPQLSGLGQLLTETAAQLRSEAAAQRRVSGA